MQSNEEFEVETDGAGDGIKTREFFSVPSFGVIELYLEADLTRSRAGIVSG